MTTIGHITRLRSLARPPICGDRRGRSLRRQATLLARFDMTFLRSAATLAGIGILLASNGVVSAESSFQRRQGKGPKRCYGIRVEPEDSPSGESRRRRDRPSFSTREVFDLSFEIRLSESAATQSLKLKIFTPNGSLYDILEAEASTGPPGKRTRSGRHRPSRRGARLATAQFPVAGTQITALHRLRSGAER